MKNVLELSNYLTVYVITIGNNPNFSDCLTAIKNQTCTFQFDIIENISPMPKAFQEMLNRCTTPYFIQVDNDMILNLDTIEKMYNEIIKTNDKIAMVCYRLHDVHLNFPLYGVKIYKTELFKKYPYNQNVISAEVEQVARLKEDGYIIQRNQDIVGLHSPKYDNMGIFERYYNLMQKHQIFNYDWTREVIHKLYNIFKANPDKKNFYAISGAIAGYMNPFSNEPRDYNKYNIKYEKMRDILETPLKFLDTTYSEKKDSNQLRILRLCDQWNWAFDHITREQAKYSKHQIINKRLMDVTIDDCKDIDILYIPGPNMSKSKSDAILCGVRKKYPKCKLICGYAGEHSLMYPLADIIVSISAKWYPTLKQMYKYRKTPVVFLPESIDTEFFTPSTFPDTFMVGWAGRKADVKRCHLLEQLPFPVKIQSNHGHEFFKVQTSNQQDMMDFYHSLSCLVLTSESEAMPRVVLEAMSCGLAVITTDVGSLRMIMDKEWIVPTHPEQATVLEMGERLIRLEANPDLLKEVGKRNRQFIEENFSWKANQPIWDAFFEDVAKGHFISAEIFNKKYRQIYGQFEPALLE